jgi:Cu(I)/Ag(I) efflux system membrane fusion protein
MKNTYVALMALSGAMLLIGCTGERAQDVPADVRVDVTADLVRSGRMEETLTATGATAIRKESQMRSPVTGVLVQFALFAGDRVRAGETIALVRPKESASSLQGAEELLRMATTEQQRAEAARAIDLAKKAATTVSIRSPFDGIVGTRAKNEMDLVSEGEQIATVIDPTSIIFIADVPSASFHRVRVGQQATVRFAAKPGKVYRGGVHRVEPQMNSADQTARVQIAFSAAEGGLEGSLFGEATIIVGVRDRVLMVPESALLRDDENNTTHIMIVGPDSLALSRTVEVGMRNDSLAEVSSAGLSPGELVITQGHYGLPDSTKVRIRK